MLFLVVMFMWCPLCVSKGGSLRAKPYGRSCHMELAAEAGAVAHRLLQELPVDFAARFQQVLCEIL